MGLDMYLTGERYLWQHEEDGNDTKIAASIDKMLGAPKPLKNSWRKNRVSSINLEVMYWRKCFEINDWFMENIPDADGSIFYVGNDSLTELIEDCEQYLKDKTGYFSGNRPADQEEYLVEQLQRTAVELRDFLDTDLGKQLDYYYRCSY